MWKNFESEVDHTTPPSLVFDGNNLSIGMVVSKGSFMSW